MSKGKGRYRFTLVSWNDIFNHRDYKFSCNHVHGSLMIKRKTIVWLVHLSPLPARREYNTYTEPCHSHVIAFEEKLILTFPKTNDSQLTFSY